LAANRNGGMLRLIASRHDDDDDKPPKLILVPSNSPPPKFPNFFTAAYGYTMRRTAKMSEQTKCAIGYFSDTWACYCCENVKRL